MFFTNQRLEKVRLFSTLPKIMTMHSCTSLTFFNSFASPITIWWDVAFMDRQHGGLTMVLHGQLFFKWLLIKKNKVQQCFNKTITSPRIFGCQKRAWIIAKCLTNVICTFEASQCYKKIILMAINSSCAKNYFSSFIRMLAIASKHCCFTKTTTITQSYLFTIPI